MKNYYSFLVVLFFMSFNYVNADVYAKPKAPKVSANQKKADNYYGLMQYALAIEWYEKTIQDEPNNYAAHYKLANCYLKTFDYAKAEKHYKIVTENAVSTYRDARYYYAVMLRDNNKYVDSKTHFEKFIQENPNATLEIEEMKEQAKKAIAGIDYALIDLKKPVRDYGFNILPAPVNSIYSDFSPVISVKSDTSIVIASGRETAKGGKDNVDNTTGSGKSQDLFSFILKDKWIPSDSNMLANINTELAESAGSYTADGKKFYFTRMEPIEDKKKSTGEKYSIINYRAVIYVLKKDNSGAWGLPIKLNANVNSLNEHNSHPSISPDGKQLFFASKRKNGVGGIDIWACSDPSGKDNWGIAQNLAIINTTGNEVSPQFYGEKRLLYFSSDGHPGFGGLDVFVSKDSLGYDLTEPVNLGMPFNSSRDDFYFKLGKDKGYLASNRQGGMGNDDVYIFNILPKEDAVIAEIKADTIKDPIKNISVSGTIKNQDSKKPAENVNIAVTDEQNNKIKLTTTNSKGEFRVDDLPVGKNYKIILIEKDAKVTQLITVYVDTIQIKSSTEETKKTKFENIYFDFNSYELRPEAKKTLDEIVLYANQNEHVQIELNANADAVGKAEYNRALSEKRGAEAMKYLKEKGMDVSQIVVSGFGSDRPLAPNLNEIGRQLNRRVEFYVLGGGNYETHNMTYVVEPKATLDMVAKKFNMTIEELKELNALTTDQLIPFTPLRVKRNVDDDIIAQISMAESMDNKNKSFNKKQYKTYVKSQEEIAVAMNKSNAEIVEYNKVVEEKNKEIKHNIELKQSQKVAKLNAGEDYYKVQSKNTLFTLAKLYRMDVNELKTINKLHSDTIFVNQILKVKVGGHTLAPNEYLVKKGETIETISDKVNVSVEKLKEWNHIEGYVLQQNMILWINKE